MNSRLKVSPSSILRILSYSMKLYDGYNQSSQEIDASHTNFYNSPTAPTTYMHTFILNFLKEFILEIFFGVCPTIQLGKFNSDMA